MKIFSTFFILSIAFLSQVANSDNYRDFSALYTQGMINGESRLFTTMFAENVKILPEYDKSYIGQRNATNYYESIYENLDISSYTRTAIEITEMGSQSVEIGSFKMTFKPKGSDNSLTVPGTYFEVWDTSSENNHKLLTQAWNYDKAIEGVENIFRSNASNGIHYAFESSIAVTSPLTYEISAINNFGETLMLRQQPEALHLIYAEDCWNAHHNVPMLKGKSAIRDFMLDYTKNWPVFDYVSVNTHQVYDHNDTILEHFSYNLRWQTKTYSGVSLGKGVRLLKRNKQGILQIHRIISMHD